MYLERRYRKFYALHDIPADIQHALGKNGKPKARFVKSLDTGDREQALIRAAVLEAQWRSAIERARMGSTAQLEQDAAFWRDAMRTAKTPAERGAVLDQIADVADGMVKSAAISEGIFDEQDPRYQELPVHETAGRFISIATGKLTKLNEHLEEYLGTLTNHQAKTVDMKRSTIGKFCEEFPYVADVQRKTLQQWVNRHAQHGAAVATIRRLLSEMRGYWAYLLSIEAIPDGNSPFDKLSLPTNGKNGREDERKPFAPGDVLKLVAEAHDRKDAQLADLIELAMWTGARIEELCALPVAKVNMRARYFEIADAKTPAGWRQVPIHSKLHPTVARLIKDSEDGYVLSGLTRNKYGDRSNAVGKRFGHLKRALGFGEDRVFHSIRKTVATLLEDAGVPENVSADILGHEKPTMTYGLYSGGTSLATKRKALEKLGYRAGAR